MPHVHNLLLTLFGLYVASTTSQVLRVNITKLSPTLWQRAREEFKYRFGVTIDGYRTNLQDDKLGRGIEFLTAVNGRRYETLPARIIALETLAERLDSIHDGWDNYHHEPPIMREIMQYCSKSTDIPPEVLPKLVRVVVRCRVGRGLSYKEGVSPSGRPLYDDFLRILDDNGIIQVIISLFGIEVNSKLTEVICQKQLKSIIDVVRPLAIGKDLIWCLDHLSRDLPNAARANTHRAFLDHLSQFADIRLVAIGR